MKKNIVVFLPLILTVIGLSAVAIGANIITSDYSFADNTTVTVVVGSPNDVIANLAVNTPGNANVNLGVNAGNPSVNLNGVNESQVTIQGQNVASNRASTANAVSVSLAGTQFNQENYNMWVVPLRNRLDATLDQLADNQDNIDMTMAATAKTISVLQEQSGQLRVHRQLIDQAMTEINNDILAREKLQASLKVNFGYVDDQFQKTIDRDKIILSSLSDVQKNANFMIKENADRIDSLVNRMSAVDDRIEATEYRVDDQMAILRQNYNDMVILFSVLFGIVVLSLIFMSYKIAVKR